LFDPVVVPGQGEEPTAPRLRTEIADWIHSEPLRALIGRFGGGTMPGGGLAAELAYLDEFTADAWHFRTEDGEERNQIDLDAISGADEELALAAADALGLERPRPPRYRHYDHVVMLGGLVRANLWRPAYAAHLLRTGVTAGNVVAISAYRDLARNPEHPDRDEYKLLEVFGLPRRGSEWEVMEDGLRRAFDLPAFTVEAQSGPEADGWERFRVASASSAEHRVTLVVAPSPDPGRRANTADGYRYWAGQVGHVQPGQRVLAVTTSIYVPYQHAVAIQLLGLPFGCSIDTVGIDFTVIDNGRSPQDLRGVSYLLEIRSAIRAYRHLDAMLDSDAVAAQQVR
jgi:hypothetical protein